jgi:hypothetical protein
MAAEAVYLLQVGGASEEIVGLVIDAIAAWEAENYQNRAETIAQLRSDSSSTDKE